MSDIGPGDVVVVVDDRLTPGAVSINTIPRAGTRQVVGRILESGNLAIVGFPNICVTGCVRSPGGRTRHVPVGDEIGWNVMRFRKANGDDLGELLKALDVRQPGKVDA